MKLPSLKEEKHNFKFIKRDYVFIIFLDILTSQTGKKYKNFFAFLRI